MFLIILRSKKFSSPQSSAAKRPKVDGEVRKLRIKEIEDDVKSFKESIKFKERRRLQAESARDYKVCEDLTVEIRENQHKVRELEAELKLYQAKEKKSMGYHHRKSLTQKSPSPLSSEPEANRGASSASKHTLMHKFCAPVASDSGAETTSSHLSSASSNGVESQVDKAVVQLDCEETVIIESDSHVSSPASPLSPVSSLTPASPVSPPLSPEQSFV